MLDYISLEKLYYEVALIISEENSVKINNN